MAFDPSKLSPRRRELWSLRKIAEEIGGRPIGDFQDPPEPRGIAQYPDRFAGRLPRRSGPSEGGETGSPGPSAEGLGELDPVQRVYPPLTRANGRAWHGVEREHHAPTLEAMQGPREPPAPGQRSHPPGPSTRPERVYLHYLLLHLDRLSDHALRYLHRAVTEELDARAPPPPLPASPVASPPPGS